jgi:hypothetical protein
MCIYGIFRTNFRVHSVQGRKNIDPTKVHAIMNMLVPANPRQIQVFNGMALFYRCFIKKIAFIMAPITKLTKRTKPFIWTIEYQEAWIGSNKLHGNINFDTSKLAIGVHVHTNASLLVVGVMLAQNLIGKYDQCIVYASRLLNKTEQNYTTIEIEALKMVYALHKFKKKLLGNKFVFYAYHMALVYLVNEPYVLGRITRWLLFLEYEFTVVYKPSRTRIVVGVLSMLPYSSEPLGVSN